MNLNEEEIVGVDAPIEIDLNALKSEEMNEDHMKMLGNKIKWILQRMFGGSSIPIKIKGSRRDVSAFARTIGREKDFLQSYMKFGMDSNRTKVNRYKLEQAISKFKNLTGIGWPFR